MKISIYYEKKLHKFVITFIVIKYANKNACYLSCMVSAIKNVK